MSGLGYKPPLRGKKPRATADRLAFVLEGLPGVSANLARRLAERFGSLAGLVAASDAELREIEGLGPKRLAQILTVNCPWAPARWPASRRSLGAEART